MDFELIKSKKVAELREIAAALKIEGADKLKKKEIVALLLEMHEQSAGEESAEKTEAASEENAVSLSPEVPVKRKRGRPRKHPVPGEQEEPSESSSAADFSIEEASKLAPPAEDTPAKEVQELPDAEASVQEIIAESGASGAEIPGQAPASDLPSETPAPAAPKEYVRPAVWPKRKYERRTGRIKAPVTARIGTVSAEIPRQSPAPVSLPEEVSSKPAVSGETSGIIPEECPSEEPRAAERPRDDVSQPEKVYTDRYETTGILDLTENGFGFLRFDNFLTSDKDVYVSPIQIRRFNLKTGDEICAIVREPGGSDRFGALLFVKTVNGDEPGVARRRKDFSELTPIFPNRRISLEKGSSALSMRLADLVSPIGFGQRGLIVSPPKAGKTTLLKQIAKAIENQNLDAELIVLLIDERPEEVTDMQRSINGRVVYSTFDEQPSHHVKVAEMTLARAQRLVEHGKNVIILLDSITRLARAYNLVEPPSGRTLSGGLDPAALYKPKKFFGAARNIEEGGSITVLATALVETGSRMDDVIFEEFKGTGNMELHLDRNLSEKRIFPAISLNKSGTRREDMLMTPEELEGVWMMRRALADWGTEEATERIVMDLVQSKSNALFLERFRKTRL